MCWIMEKDTLHGTMITDTDEEMSSNDRFYTTATSNIMYRIGEFSKFVIYML